MSSNQQRQKLLPGASTHGFDPHTGKPLAHPHSQQQQQQQQRRQQQQQYNQQQGQQLDPHAREIQRLAPRMRNANGEITIVAMRRTYTLAKRMVYCADTRRCMKFASIALAFSGVLAFYLWASSNYGHSSSSGDDDVYGPNGPNMALMTPVMMGSILAIFMAARMWVMTKASRPYAIWENVMIDGNGNTTATHQAGNSSRTGKVDPWAEPHGDLPMGWAKFLENDNSDELSGVDPQTMVQNLSNNMKVLTSKLQGFNYNYSTTAQQLASDGLAGVTIEGHAGDRRDQYHAPPAAANPTAFQKAVPTAVAMPLPRPAGGSAAPASKFCNQCAAPLTPGCKFCSQCAVPI
jgi:hypothetical protein